MTKEQVIFYGEFFKELGLSELKVVNRDEELYLKKDVCGTNNACYLGEASKGSNTDVISKKLSCIEMNDGANTNVTGNADSITSNVDNNGLVIEKTIVQESASNNVVNNQTVVESTSNMVPVKAPLIGIYYAKPSPSAEAFVKVGDYVNKGDVLCIIEAMKMFNEIKAEVSGRIEEICVNNGNVVEYGQTLFNIIP